MSNETPKWRKMKNKESEKKAAETLLRANESKCVSACGRFLSLDETKGHVWLLSEKKTSSSALIIYCKGTVIPVLCAGKELPSPDFLKEFVKKKEIHSLQGQKEDVLVLENITKQMGARTSEIFRLRSYEP